MNKVDSFFLGAFIGMLLFLLFFSILSSYNKNKEYNMVKCDCKSEILIDREIQQKNIIKSSELKEAKIRMLQKHINALKKYRGCKK